jgi:PAS domain S-box-containing protein
VTGQDAAPPSVDPRLVPYGEGVDLVRDLLDRAPVPIVIFGSDRVILYTNGPFEAVFGYSRAEIVGRPYEALFPDRLQDELRGRVEAYLAQPEPPGLAGRPDYLARRKDGSEFPMQYTSTVVDNRHGIWVVVTIFDVSREREDAARIADLTRSYRALARMNQAVLRARDVTTLYAETCAVGVDEGRFLAAWVGEPDPDGRIVPVAVAGELDDYVRDLVITTDPALPTSAGPTGRAFREGRPVASRDFERDPRTAAWHEAAARFRIRSSLSLPLRRDGRVTAVLSLYADRADAFGPAESELLDDLADNVSFALDALDATARLARISDQREVLLQRLGLAQEEERRRVAADLHDEPVQTLAAVELRLGLLQREVVAGGGPGALDQLQVVRGLVADTLGSLREVMFDLEPVSPATGWADALSTIADHVLGEEDLEVVVEVEPVEVAEAVRGQALRIVKEALINVRKHAGADRVVLSVAAEDDAVLIRVVDDGSALAGEDLEPRRGHRGLQTMRERAELVGGHLATRVTEGGGLEVSLRLPRG